MAEEEKKTTQTRNSVPSKKGTKVPASSGKRSKPKFLRTDWHKKIRLGRGVKKNQKWHGAKGRQNKLRLGRKGRMQRPKIGWGADAQVKDFISGMEAVRVENVKDDEAVARNSIPSKLGTKVPSSSGKKGVGIIIAKVGAKKKADIIAKAKEMKLTVLNRYRKTAEVKA